MNGPSATDAKGADNSNDIFGYFMSGSTTNGNNPVTAAAAAPNTTATVPSTASNNATKPPAESTLAQQEHDFFNQVPNEKEKAKMTKDSILALYGQAPTMPTANQFMPGMQPMPTVDANGSLFGMPMQYQQQPHQSPAFGMQGAAVAGGVTAPGVNNFAQFGMMGAPAGAQPTPQMNFQAIPNQSMGFSNVPSAMNPTPMQAFNQANLNKTNAFASGAPSNVNNVNQQFGSLNLGNVWQ